MPRANKTKEIETVEELPVKQDLKEPKVLQNAFKDVARNTNFVSKILNDVTGINLSDLEINKLKVLLRYDTKGSLFGNIETIYQLIGANFESPEKVIVIPFMDNRGSEHLNIQRIGR